MDLVTPDQTEYVLAHVESSLISKVSPKLLVGGTYHFIDRYCSA
jgi:hypothetical protein